MLFTAILILALSVVGYRVWLTLTTQKSKKSLRLKPPPDRLDPYTQRNLQLEMLFAKPQSLQVFFNFNGHVFEAYEVLGLPLGASYEEVLRHYRQLPPEAKNELIEQAFLALKQHFTGSRTPNNF